MRNVFGLLAAAMASLAASTAFAQAVPEPLPVVVVDARVALPRFGQSALTATTLGVNATDLPTFGLAPVIGVQIYPLRANGFALGIGGEYITAHVTNQPVDTTGKALGPAVERQFRSTSAQLSFNFGHQRGWSYLSAGMGPVTFDTYLAGTTPDGQRLQTLNYGGGARWFSAKHVAFSLDLRFYATKPVPATSIVGARLRQTLMVFSAGISIK